LHILFLNRHNHSAESTSVAAVARTMGHSLAQDFEDIPDLIVCIDWTKSMEDKVKLAYTLGIPRVLIKLEPSVVIPEYQKLKVSALFTAVMEMGRPFSQPVYAYPQGWETSFFERAGRLDRLVAINANKYSFVPGELYSLRASAYSKISSLDLYGRGWDRSVGDNLLKLAKELQIAILGGSPVTFACVKNLYRPPKNFMGVSETKLETLSRYKYSLVIENSLEYMTEKLIDSLMAGAMPIYVGPDVEKLGIPPALYYSASASLESVKKSVARARDASWKDWHDAARKWISDPASEEIWEVRKLNRRLVNEIEQIAS